MYIFNWYTFSNGWSKRNIQWVGHIPTVVKSL